MSQYSTAIVNYPEGSFDVIVIDGAERVSCAREAVPRLKQDGIIIFDNSDRPAYQKGVELLHAARLGRIDFYGFVPVYGVVSCTSVFIRFSLRWTGGEVPLVFQNYSLPISRRGWS
ncbi:MAG TPA: hypothetical protein VFD30_20945 [Terriglobia bacterium]|jgi:hypothetical protein|nr:hypothetical protein [Terriglobia bacterium]